MELVTSPFSRLLKHVHRRRCLAPLGLLLAVAVAAVGVSPLLAQLDTIRIMPLGDSITEATDGDASYRYWLWHSLLDGNYDVNFVGSRSGVYQGEPAFEDFDQDHEGHWGWRADQILAEIAGWSSLSRPDMVLIHLGTNDLWQGQTVSSTLQELGSIIDSIRVVNDDVMVLIAQIIPATVGILQDSIPALNAQIPLLASQKSTPQSPVVVVDQHAGFDPYADTYDGVHPNVSGEQKMAAKWDSSLVALLDSVLAPPRVVSIKDVENDQGRRARVVWDRCYWDAPGAPVAITDYGLWRRSGQQEISRGGDLVASPEGDRPNVMSAYPPGDWDFVASVPAQGDSSYSVVCSTLVDSTKVGGMVWSVFFVSALTPEPLVFFDSPPDSGYSVDNLAPAAPQGLSAAVSDSVLLAWLPNDEEDLAFYAIYRGVCPDFLPDVPLDYTTDTVFVDTAMGYCYKVSAFDQAGNESPLAGPVSVGEEEAPATVPTAFLLYQNRPNPFNPVTEIGFALPQECHVRLEIFNLRGQRVATLMDGRQRAGYKVVRWDAGSLASGIYFCRFTVGDLVQTKKMVLLQ